MPAAQREGWRCDEWQHPFGEGSRHAVVCRHPRKRLTALMGQENISPGPDSDWRWHISVRHEERVPTWDELAFTAHSLRPGVALVAGVPPRSQWINVHEHVLHLWQVDDPVLQEQWAAERCGDVPS